MSEHNKKLKYNPSDIDGNPRGISKSKILEICNLIKCGNYVKTSVKACGVNFNTFNTYMRKGKKGVEPYDEYYELVETAKGEAEAGMVGRIHESALNGNVGADMWRLARMFPNRWASTKRVEAKVDNSQKIEIVKYSDKDNKD